MNKINNLLQILFGCVFFIYFNQTAKAQIIPDNTLGAEASRLTPNVLINGANADRIHGGAQRGINLFHSFSEFNIDDGQRVYFSNPSLVENIFSRITGNNASNILGTLGVNGNANLFLINPNGILFGENSSLDVGGSFVGTTANQVGFGEQGFFSASNPEIPVLLTVSADALFFNQVNRNAEIKNSSTAAAGIDPAGFLASGLRVPDGKSLLLVGGNVSLEGGILNALGGRVELGGLAEAGTVGLDIDGNNFQLKFPDNVTRGDVSLTNQSRIFVEAGGGGDIIFNARNIDILDRSFIVGGIAQGLGTSETIAGDINLNATGEITFTDESGILNYVRQDSQGNLGQTNINTGILKLINEAEINTSNFATGNGADVNITAKDAVILDNSEISAEVDSIFTDSTSKGNAGNININTKLLQISNSSRFLARNTGIGNPGNININAESVGLDTSNINAGVIFGNAGNVNLKASGSVSLDNESNISASVLRGDGKGGNILIDAQSLFLNNGSLIGGIQGSGTTPGGSAGNITVRTDDLISLDNSSNISASAFVGFGGNISLDTKKLSLENGSRITANVFGEKPAASITINATESVEISGSDDVLESGLLISALGNGDAGDLTINTERLIVKDGGNISTNAALTPTQAILALINFQNLLPSGIGNAGNIEINARESVQIIGTRTDKSSVPSSIIADGSGGNGGAININTSEFTIDNGAQISARTSGDKQAGDILLIADFLQANNGSNITTSTSDKGDAGNIIIRVKDDITLIGENTGVFANTTENSTGRGGTIDIDPINLTVKEQAAIAVDSQGSGIAGDIKLTAGFFTLDNGTVSAETRRNTGGNIDMNLQNLLLLRNGSKISTTAGNQQFSGNGGNIDINSTFVTAIPGENSDITTNSFAGKGGRIDITAQGILGLEIRNRLTPLSDITAFSELSPTLNGEITLNTPNVDPSQGTIELPQTIIDPDALIAQNPCLQRKGSEFIVTGKGGLPVNPNQVLNADAVEIDLVETAPLTTTEKQASINNSNNISNQKTVSINNKIVPARGWVVSGDEVILTAYAANGKQIRRQEDNFSACRTK